MQRSLWYPPTSPLLLLTYCPDSRWHNDEKLIVLCGGHSCSTSAIFLLGEFPFCWLYILIVFLIFILAQFPLQALEIFPINIWVFFFFVNIPFRLFLQMTSLTVIFTKAVYFKRFFQGKFDFKFIIPVN